MVKKLMNPGLPTALDIAKAHGLVRRVSTLGDEVNYVPNMFLATFLYRTVETCFYIFNSRIMYQIQTYRLQKDSSENKVNEFLFFYTIGFVTAICLFGWFLKKVWDKGLLFFKTYFPNGIGIEKTPYDSHSIQDAIRSNSLQEYVRKLQVIVKEQKWKIKRNIWGVIALSFILIIFRYPENFLFVIRNTHFIDILAKCVGTHRTAYFFPSIVFYPAIFMPISPTHTDIFILEVSSLVQKLLLYNFIASTWSNWDLSKQFNKYTDQLNKLTHHFAGKSWEIVTQETNKGLNKDEALFQLDFENVQNGPYVLSDQTDKDGNQLSVSIGLFRDELYRLLLENKLDVVSSGKAIYLGYHHMTLSKIEQLQKTFQDRLVQAAIYEKKANDITLTLTHLWEEMPRISGRPKKGPEWDSYRQWGPDAKAEEYYTANIIDLPPPVRLSYIAGLRAAFGDQFYVMQNEKTYDVFIRNIDVVNEAQLTQIKHDFRTSVNTTLTKQKDKGVTESAFRYDDYQSTTSSSSVRRPHATFQSAYDKKDDGGQHNQTEKQDFQRQRVPDVIEFPSGATFNPNQPTNDIPDDEALSRLYQLYMPYLANGRAYASILPGVVTLTENYLGKKEILARLQSGVVHGRERGYHTKAMGVGIQFTDEAYQTIEGENVKHANLKLKFMNNLRIFGRRRESTPGGEYIHYQFDGVGFGH